MIERDGKVLVCRGIGDSVWEFPGGRLHQRESPRAGLAREILEELGVSVTVREPFHADYFVHKKNNAQHVLIAYFCSIVGEPSLRIDRKEIEEVRWVSRDELKTFSMFEDCRGAADAFLSGAGLNGAALEKHRGDETSDAKQQPR